jgi:ribose transport system substrate-binding protein
LGNKGKVVVSFGSPGDENHQKRVDGLEDWFAENTPGIEVIGQVVDCDNAEGTVRCAEEALATFPEMNAYYSTGNMNAVGATQVFPAAGRDDIIITAVDDAPEVLDAIRQGINIFSYGQQPYGQGYFHVYLNWLMVHKGVKPTQKFVDMRIFFIDKDNVETYKETMKQNFLEVKEYVEKEVMK